MKPHALYGHLQSIFKQIQIQIGHIVQNNLDISIQIVLFFKAFIADIDETEYYFVTNIIKQLLTV